MPAPHLDLHTRQLYHSGRIGRDVDFDLQLVAGDGPRTFDETVRTEMSDLGVGKRTTGLRFDEDSFPAGREGRDATDVRVEEIGDGSEGVVIEGGHLA